MAKEQLLEPQKRGIEHWIKTKLAKRPIPEDALERIVGAVLDRGAVLIDTLSGNLNEEVVAQALDQVLHKSLTIGLVSEEENTEVEPELSDFDKVVSFLKNDLASLAIPEDSHADIAGRLMRGAESCFDHNGQLRQGHIWDSVRQMRSDAKLRHLFTAPEPTEAEKAAANAEARKASAGKMFGMPSEVFLALDPARRLAIANAEDAKNAAHNARAKREIANEAIVARMAAEDPAWQSRLPEHRNAMYERIKAELAKGGR